MKKSLFFAGLTIAAILSLTNCSKETQFVEEPFNESTFALIANLSETKTTISGYDVSWEAGDAMNVFYESTDAIGTYTPTTASVSKFVTTAGDGVFTPNSGSFVAPTSGTNNWYVFYPYNSYMTTPNNVSAGRSTISSNQTQTGNDNTSHLAALCPMAGNASSVAYNSVPSVNMKQLASVICVNVTNSTASPVTVSKITIDNTVDGDGITGQYYINFLDPDDPVYTAVSASTEAQLAVSGGSAIAASSEAKFYLAVKPFTLDSGNDLSVTVTLFDEKAQTKTKNFVSDVDFQPGKVKTINFNLDAPIAASYDFTSVSTLKDLTFGTSSPGTAYSGKFTDAIVTYVDGKYAYIEDGDEGIMVFMTSHGLTAGDKIDGPVDIVGYKYNGLLELTTISYTSATVTPGQPVPETVVTDLSKLTTAVTYADYESRRVKLENMTVTASFGGSDKDGVISDGVNTYNIRSQVNSFDTFEEGAVLTFIGYPAIYNTTYQFALWEAPTIVTDSPNLRFANATPSVSVGGTVTNAATSAKGSTGTITYSSSNTSIATVDDSGVITGVAAGTATITASITAASGFCAGTATCEVTVSASKTYTITWNSTNNSKSVSTYTASWSVTADGLTCNMANFNNNSNGWNYVKCGRKNNASVATIITASYIPEAISSVTITIDAITAENVNSIKLYIGPDGSSWTEEGSFTKATGNQKVDIASPAANKYYKLEFDCASGSANGLVTLSKLVFSE